MGRQRKDCPLCSAKGLLKLSNHFVQVHDIKEPLQRRHWLDVAKKSSCGEHMLNVIVAQQEKILHLLQ